MKYEFHLTQVPFVPLSHAIGFKMAAQMSPLEAWNWCSNPVENSLSATSLSTRQVSNGKTGLPFRVTLTLFSRQFSVERPKNGAIYLPITIFGITEINFDAILYISVGANV